MKTFLALTLLVGLFLVSPALATDDAGDEAFAVGDYATAYRTWLEAAERGDSNAIEAIGMMYDTGHAVPQDFGTAFKWYLRAAKAGSIRAMFDVGVLYDNGRGVPRNRSIAINWYKLAAEKGYGRAAYDLGVIYRDGDGVPRDVSASIHYFRIAEADGVKAARQNLAMLAPPRPPPVRSETTVEHENFQRFQTAALERVNVDSTAAAAFADRIASITKEANSDNQLAQYDVGFAYEHGIGVAKDAIMSYVFYMRATLSTGNESVRLAAIKGCADVRVLLSAVEYHAALSMLSHDPEKSR